jgi:glutamyl-tRNA reductase
MWCNPAKTAVRQPAQAEVIIDAGVQNFMHWLAVIRLTRCADSAAERPSRRLVHVEITALRPRTVDKKQPELRLTQRPLHGTLAELHSGDSAYHEATAQAVTAFLRGQSPPTNTPDQT